MIETEPTAAVERAFAAARRAQPGWAATDPRRRAEPFLALHRLLLDHREDVLDVIGDETGKARGHAAEELMDAVASILFYARKAPSLVRCRS